MAVVGWIIGIFLASYFEIRSKSVAGFGILLIFLACQKYNKAHFRKSKSLQAILGLFSGLLSFTIVLGAHIHVERPYAGKIEENYITSFGIHDIVAFFFIMAGIYVLAKTIYIFGTNSKKTQDRTINVKNRISYKQVVVVAVIIFMAWLPYLVTYYPGQVFGDTLTSIGQVMGYAPLNNHHPICYTLFIKFCFKIGALFGGNTAGCVCYCIIQMVYMASFLAYISCWIYRRMNLKKIGLFFLIIFYGCIPYFAQMSIAMWKDPIFAVTIALLTIMLTDYILLQEENGKGQKFFWIKYTVLLLITIFIRNNGIYMAFFMAVMAFFMIIWIRCENIRKALRKLGICTILIVIISQIVVGPIYNRMGIIKEKVESYGIFLNQMARVVAYDGKMTEEDKEYMNQLLPLESYKDVYSPCCVDPLKWNPEFNADALDNNFFKHYISMFVKNPKLYFEAWELQTYGFWTINRDEINNYDNNILGGMPRNYYYERFAGELEPFDIKAGKYVNNPVLTKLFPIDDIGIPIGMLTWGVLFLIIILWFREQKSLLITLTPTVGMLITLIIASPINYWPRYGAAAQYLLPFYIVLFMNGKRKKENK